MVAGEHLQTGRGIDLLLAHCAVLMGVERERPSALERLADALGEERARALVGALSGDKGRGSFRLADPADSPPRRAAAADAGVRA